MSEEEPTDVVREPEAKEGKSEDIFEVERILTHKVTDNSLLLKVRWVGYGPEEDTWEPEEDLKESAGEVVREYYQKMKVNDKTELIELLQKKIKQTKAQKPKKRERTPSDDDGNESDGSSVTSNKQKKKSKKSTTSRAQKVPTKAALKSYEASSSGPATPNNAKKAAMVVRDNRWFGDSDNSDDEAPAQASDIDVMRNKVKSKPTQQIVPTPPENGTTSADSPTAEEPAREEKSGSPQPSCSNNYPPKKKPILDVFGRCRAVNLPEAESEDRTTWNVDGIVRHTDQYNVQVKVILMTSATTGEKRIVDAKDAFKLDGWALTKYLLDRCEF